MEQRKEEILKTEEPKKVSLIEKIGKKIPDPVIIFAIFYVVVLAASFFLGGKTFETMAGDGSYTTNTILNALLNNWLAYGGGVLGTILVVMLGVGLAEESGLLSTLIKKVGLKVSDKMLPIVLVFLGIMSSIATDAGYVILIPLAGLLYAGLKKNPLIGMAAAFAGVSAGFSANLIPATPIDIIIGNNAKIFAEGQGVPFVNAAGQALNPATMHYYFVVASTFLLAIIGAFVTIKIIKPRLEKESYIIPADMNLDDFTVKKEENKALKFAGLGFLIAVVCVVGLYFGPLKTFISAKVGKFKNANDVVRGMSKQMGSMGSVLVLTFFSYNFLALLSKSGLGTYITYLGGNLLKSMNLQDAPILLIIGFIVITAIINLFVGGLTSKWMLLGPIFLPMLYQVNSNMTPEVVAAAYRVADSSTNIITPLMSYAGIILVFMRKYKPEYTIGDMIRLMMPYSVSFLVGWTILLLGFFAFGIPFGF